MPKKQVENSRKVAGNAKKAAAAAAKADAENSKKAADEAAEWEKGAKSNAKKEAAESKKRDAAAKKAAAAAALAEEEASLPSKPKGTAKPGPAKRARGGIDSALGSLNASGLDDALDALTLATGADKGSVDRHPERRYKAAYIAYEERRLPEVREEHKGLRLGQMKELIKKEFERSDENPFNQVGNVRYDATKDDIALAKKAELDKIEARLGGK